MMKKTGLILAFILMYTMSYSQNKIESLFKNGDRVCFIGNSITNNGEFYNFIYLYYATRFPEQKVQFINCGISGDVSAGVLRRMDSDILVHKPNWSVLMVGMNDVKRNLYAPGKATDPETEKLKLQAFKVYKENTDSIVKILKAQSQVILQKPTIYDETGTQQTENYKGVNEALKFCGDHVKFLSEKYQTKLVDYWTIMNSVNRDMQLKDSTTSLISKDRVHPVLPGHFVMAYQFLKDTGSPKYVSKISIATNLEQSKKQSFNCEVQSQTIEPDSITFSCLEYSLPFPVRDDAEKGLDLVPFTNDFNNQILQVPALTSGKYRLFIDRKMIGDYTGEELKKGINLATEKSTPQYAQALKVMNLCMLYRKTEALLRNLKFVEIGHLKDLENSNDSIAVSQFLEKRLENYKNGGHYGYYQTQFKSYITNKPKKTITEGKLKYIQASISKSNKPVSHDFKLVKIR